MSTLLDVLTSLRSALTAQLSISTEFASDYNVDLETMSASVAAQAQTMYRIRSQHQQAAEGSNTTYQSGAIEVVVSHRLSDPFDERAYTEGAMLTQQGTLLDRQFWRDLSGLFQVEDDGGPELEGNVERNGNIITWSVVVTFLITPA